MSAAEPARPPILNTGDAAVIDIGKRARGHATTTGTTGRWAKVSDRRPVDPPDGDNPEPSRLELLAEDFETTFNAARLTLTDEDTLNAFTVTVGIFRHILEGARAEGIIDAAQLAELNALTEGMVAATRLI